MQVFLKEVVHFCLDLNIDLWRVWSLDFVRTPGISEDSMCICVLVTCCRGKNLHLSDLQQSIHMYDYFSLKKKKHMSEYCDWVRFSFFNVELAIQNVLYSAALISSVKDKKQTFTGFSTNFLYHRFLQCWNRLHYLMYLTAFFLPRILTQKIILIWYCCSK